MEAMLHHAEEWLLLRRLKDEEQYSGLIDHNLGYGASLCFAGLVIRLNRGMSRLWNRSDSAYLCYPYTSRSLLELVCPHGVKVFLLVWSGSVHPCNIF